MNENGVDYVYFRSSSDEWHSVDGRVGTRIKDSERVKELEKVYEDFLIEDCIQCRNHIKNTLFEVGEDFDRWVCSKGLSPERKCRGFEWR